MSIRLGESFDLFISYAHRDNARHQVRELRDAILEDFHQFAGRELKIFFDEDDIPSMTDWERRIAQGLRESRVFLAVLSPQFFDSPYCRREVEEYVRYEAMRHCLGDGVAPVYFIELPGLGLNDVEKKIAAWAGNLRKPQLCDLRPWHDEGRRVLEQAHVAERLQSLKSEIKERLSRAERTALSPTNIYRHNPQFVGRTRELTRLREALNEGGSVGVVGQKSLEAGASTAATAVHGVGGMGKTELALAYAHAFGWNYPGGRWLARCEGLDNFDLVLRQFAAPMGITFTEEEQKDAHRAGERILAELRRLDRSLLLLDNVTQPELLGPDVLMRLPSQGHVHLLATTRLGPAQIGGSPHDHTFVAVDELPADDALALIRAHQPLSRFASPEDEAAARELVQILDGFTLAVETAAIHLGRHAGPGAIAAFCGRLRRELLAESEAAAADSAVAVRHKEKLLERTLAITFETLDAEQLHILALAALLPSDQIALPWLQAVAGQRHPAFLPAEHETGSRWEQAIHGLLSLRLFQPAQDWRVVRMHKMIQSCILHRENDALKVIETSVTDHLRKRAHFIWAAWVKQENRWEIGPLVACARQWLERTGDVGAYLANEISLPLQGIGDSAIAEDLLRFAVGKTRQVLGEDHGDHAACLGNLALVLKHLGRLPEAEALARRALNIDEKLFGLEHAVIGKDLNNLAVIKNWDGKAHEQEQLLRRIVSIFEKSLGETHSALAPALSNLGHFLITQNRFDEAESILRRALKIAEENHGAEHPDMVTPLNNLAQVLLRTERLEEGEMLTRRMVGLCESIHGAKHPMTALAIGNLASLLGTRQSFEEAKMLMQRQLEILTEAVGATHGDTVRAQGDLGFLLYEMGNHVEAEKHIRTALAAKEQVLGKEDPSIMPNLRNLAALLMDTDRKLEAEALIRRSIAIQEKAFGKANPRLAADLINFSLVLVENEKLEEAENTVRGALSILWD